METERAIAIIERIIAPKTLNAAQIRTIRGVLQGRSYQQIATAPGQEPYKIAYIRETGAQLWQLLTRQLGQKVTKSSLAAVLLWYSKQPEYRAAIESAPWPRASADWGEPIHPRSRQRRSDGKFYGRTQELALLTDWCVSSGCRTISLVGMGGMGKTTLAWEIAHQLEAQFERTIWRSLLNLPKVSDLCADLLQFLSPQPLAEIPESLAGQLELLIAQLNRSRCLLILDNVESILAGGVRSGQYLPGYVDYDLFLRVLSEFPHQSCILLTSREKPHTLVSAQTANPALVRSLDLGGIEPDWGHQLIQDYGCPPLPPQMWQEVHAHYGGNPLALKIATIGAVELTGGGQKMLELYPLMQQGKLPFRDIDDVLQRQFDRLSPAERQLVYWLAIEREPVTGKELRANLVGAASGLGATLDALRSLSQRCVTVNRYETWSIQPVMMAYVTTRSIELFAAELSVPLGDPIDLRYHFTHLNSYALIKAQTKDYLRQAQVQTILHPLRDRLLAVWGDSSALSAHLRQAIRAWQNLSPIPSGYLAGNILNLLVELATERKIADLDCAALPIRSAYLAGVELHRVNFTAADFDRSVFTQTFGGVFFALYHPGGELVATSDANANISLWQIADSQRVGLFQGHTNWVRALTFSPNGELLVSSSEDRTLRIWQVQTGERLAVIGPHTHSFRAMKFSADGCQLAVSCDDARIRFYHVADLVAAGTIDCVERHCTRKLVGHQNWIFGIEYSPDWRRLASASADGTVRIWDLETGACLQIFAHQHWAIRVLFSPDGRYLFVSGLSATIYVWDTHTATIVRTMTGHQDWIWSIESSVDGRTLYSTGEDRTIRSWDWQTGECLSAVRAHQQRVWTLALSPDGRQLVSGSDDCTIKLWELQGHKCVKTIEGYGNWIRTAACVPGRNWLVSCHRDRTVRLWDLAARTCIQTLTGHEDAVIKLAVSPDGRYVASGSLDRTIRLWDLQDFTRTRTIDAGAEICALAFSPDGRKLISGSYRGELQLWPLPDLAEIPARSLSHPNRIEAVAVCGVSRTIATACETKIWIWDLDTGTHSHAIDAHALNVLALSFSPDGRYLASGGMDTTAKIWDTQTWELLQVLHDRQSWVTTLAFHPHAQTSELIIGSGDRTIERWDLATGQRVQTYCGHHNWIWSVAFTPDSLQIVSASDDETIGLWELASGRCLEFLRLQRPYEGTNITAVTGVRSGQRRSLQLLGAIDE